MNTDLICRIADLLTMKLEEYNESKNEKTRAEFNALLNFANLIGYPYHVLFTLNSACTEVYGFDRNKAL